MKTLYDIIGALPEDDAEDLRIAFRKAVKANHPDLHPDNPDAALAFRRIIRANAILSDQRQREEYDRLIEAARWQQQRQEPKRSAFSTGIRRLGIDALAVAVASAAFVAGYLLLKPADRMPLASAEVTEISRSEPAQIAAVRSTELSSLERTDAGDRLEDVGAAANLQDVKEPTETASISPPVTTGHAPAATDVSPAAESGPKDVKYYRERGASAYRSGDLYVALANFDLAIQQDSACSDCYLDRGIVLHRMGDLKGAFSDVAEAKRIDASARSKAHSEEGAH
jgi:tetratricopeptide (TPR) repeat protein